MMSSYRYRFAHCLRPLAMTGDEPAQCPDHPEGGVEEYDPQPEPQ